MHNFHTLKFGEFEDDQGTLHQMIPSSVVASVPTAKAAAEQYGRAVKFDFLDDRAVHWLLFQRREDNAKAGMLGCLFALPLSVIGLGVWPFWDLVAKEESRAFQIGFIVVSALLFGAFALGAYGLRRASLLDETNRNMRCRVRLYRKIIAAARRGGADIPSMYPYFGMYITSQKFFPDAPDRPIPESNSPHDQ